MPIINLIALAVIGQNPVPAIHLSAGSIIQPVGAAMQVAAVGQKKPSEKLLKQKVEVKLKNTAKVVTKPVLHKKAGIKPKK